VRYAEQGSNVPDFFTLIAPSANIENLLVVEHSHWVSNALKVWANATAFALHVGLIVCPRTFKEVLMLDARRSVTRVAHQLFWPYPGR